MNKYQKILCSDSVWITHVLAEFHEFAEVGWSSPMYRFSSYSSDFQKKYEYK